MENDEPIKSIGSSDFISGFEARFLENSGLQWTGERCGKAVARRVYRRDQNGDYDFVPSGFEDCQGKIYSRKSNGEKIECQECANRLDAFADDLVDMMRRSGTHFIGGHTNQFAPFKKAFESTEVSGISWPDAAALANKKFAMLPLPPKKADPSTEKLSRGK